MTNAPFSRYDAPLDFTYPLYTMPSDRTTAVLQYLLPKKALTAFAGCCANVTTPIIKNYLIRSFIKKYNVNMQEALQEEGHHYADFNSFFIRALKPECRPISAVDIVSPVDGVVSEIGEISEGQLLQAKGRTYSVDELLASPHDISAPFRNGLATTLYLSPKDYHRVHMPIDATLKNMVYVPGKLFSVQPATARTIPNLFSQNERLVVFFDTAVGPMAMVLVGATIVGAIGVAWHGELSRANKRRHFTYPEPISLKKADEMGYFKLGSTVILLFADRHRVQWQPHLQKRQPIRFGEALATSVSGN